LRAHVLRTQCERNDVWRTQAMQTRNDSRWPPNCSPERRPRRKKLPTARRNETRVAEASRLLRETRRGFGEPLDSGRTARRAPKGAVAGRDVTNGPSKRAVGRLDATRLGSRRAVGRLLTTGVGWVWPADWPGDGVSVRARVFATDVIDSGTGRSLHRQPPVTRVKPPQQTRSPRVPARKLHLGR
jgi:hypothetical protein